MATFISFLLLTTLLNLCSVDAFWVDTNSCSSDYNFVLASSFAAFSMARSARDALTATPRDTNVDRLLNLLFSNPSQSYVDRIVERYTRILDVETLNPNVPIGPNGKDIVIYCNTDRIVKNTRDSWVETGMSKPLPQVSLLLL